MVKKVIESQDETHILFYEFGISQPIYREDPQDLEFSETISSAWITEDGKVGFEVDTFNSGYDMWKWASSTTKWKFELKNKD